MPDSKTMGDRIVITGADGQVGRCLATEAARLDRVVLPLSSARWDITDPSAGEGIVESGDLVVELRGLHRRGRGRRPIRRAPTR